jgi:hypothetical protein
MKDFIACCGLDCETCEARLATISNDNALRKKIAKNWSELNHVEITPQMINCSGCRIPGAKTPYSNSLCPIRTCAMGKKFETCGNCCDINTCKKLAMVTKYNADALNNLKNNI